MPIAAIAEILAVVKSTTGKHTFKKKICHTNTLFRKGVHRTRVYVLYCNFFNKQVKLFPCYVCNYKTVI